MQKFMIISLAGFIFAMALWKAQFPHSFGLSDNTTQGVTPDQVNTNNFCVDKKGNIFQVSAPSVGYCEWDKPVSIVIR